MKPSKINSKSIIALALTLFIVGSVLFASVGVKATGPATVSLVPSTSINLTYPNTLSVGSTFTVAVNIANAYEMWGCNFGLAWTPSIVHCTSVTKGTLLSSINSDASPTTTIDNTAGDTPGGFSDVLLSTDSYNGSGTLATFHFQVVGFGSGSISLTSLQLLDPSSSHVHESYTNTIPTSIPLVNPTPPPSAPTASFTFSASSPATVSGTYITIPYTASSTSITLTSTSSAGFDGLQTVPISGYSWTITSADGLFTTVTSTASSVTLATVGAGPTLQDVISVSLTVTASESSPPSGYVSTSTAATQSLTIIQQAATGVDVYTQQGGVGANVPSGPFGPQQQVVATAYVISNVAPVAQKDVEFYVTDNNGHTFDSAVAVTDETGHCSISFRLPTIDTGVEQGFGSNWQIQAIVDISQVQYVDNCQFTFNYLANIAPGVTVTPSPVVRGSGQVTITAVITTLPNNPTSLQGMQVTFTVLDSNNVPVAAALVVPALTGTSTTVQEKLNIPNYAFTGTATVNVNILTPLGDPYCPQNGEVVTFNSNGIYTGATENSAATFSITH